VALSRQVLPGRNGSDQGSPQPKGRARRPIGQSVARGNQRQQARQHNRERDSKQPRTDPSEYLTEPPSNKLPGLLSGNRWRIPGIVPGVYGLVPPPRAPPIRFLVRRIRVMGNLLPVPVFPAVGTHLERPRSSWRTGVPQQPRSRDPWPLLPPVRSRLSRKLTAGQGGRRCRTDGSPAADSGEAWFKTHWRVVRSRSASCPQAEGLDRRCRRVAPIRPTAPSTPRTQVEGSGTR
jgi:hypothetical protein